MGLCVCQELEVGAVTACVRVIYGILSSYNLAGISFLCARMWNGEDEEIHVYRVSSE